MPLVLKLYHSINRHRLLSKCSLNQIDLSWAITDFAWHVRLCCMICEIVCVRSMAPFRLTELNSSLLCPYFPPQTGLPWIGAPHHDLLKPSLLLPNPLLLIQDGSSKTDEEASPAGSPRTHFLSTVRHGHALPQGPGANQRCRMGAWVAPPAPWLA